MPNSPLILSYRTIPYSPVPNNCQDSHVMLKHPIVLLRGLGRSSRFWMGFEQQISRFTDCFSIDLAGTGESPSLWGHPSTVGHARDVIRTLKSIDRFPVHLVAISFGGMVALQVSATLRSAQSDAVCSGTLISTSARCTGETRLNPHALAGLLSTLFRRKPRHSDFGRFLVSSQFLKTRPTLFAEWDQIYEAEGFAKLATLNQLLGAARFHGLSSLRSIEHPLFFVVSRGDQLVNWRNSVVLANMAKNSRLYVYNDPGHDIPTEVPDDLASRVARFCAEVEKAGVSSSSPAKHA